MRAPEDPRISALQGGEYVNETKDPTKFSATIRPELDPLAKHLIELYNDTFGSTGPGCCPEAVASILDDVGHNLMYGVHMAEAIDNQVSAAVVWAAANLLRGMKEEQAIESARQQAGLSQ